MLPDDILEFEKLVPIESVLGHEFKLLKENVAKHKSAFESAPDKMDYDTSSYRRGNMAVERFLRDFLPLVRSASRVVTDRALEMLDIQQGKMQSTSIEKRRIDIDRLSQARIWQHYALSCYRQRLPRKMRRLKWYNPMLVMSLFKAWRTFRREIQAWKYSRVQWDGSRAMHAMFMFIVKVDELAASHD